MPTQKEILAEHRELLDQQWHERWPHGQWTVIHGAGRYWIAHQVRRSTSSTRCRARNAVFYGPPLFGGHPIPDGNIYVSDWTFYPSRWYGQPCKVEHCETKDALLKRLVKLGVPADVIEKVRAWRAEP